MGRRLTTSIANPSLISFLPAPLSNIRLNSGTKTTLAFDIRGHECFRRHLISIFAAGGIQSLTHANTTASLTAGYTSTPGPVLPRPSHRPSLRAALMGPFLPHLKQVGSLMQSASRRRSNHRRRLLSHSCPSPQRFLSSLSILPRDHGPSLFHVCCRLARAHQPRRYTARSPTVAGPPCRFGHGDGSAHEPHG